MSFTSIFGGIGKGILKVADIGDKLNLPVLSQIDAVADSLRDIEGKRKMDKDAIADIVDSLKELKTAIPTVVPASKAALESNRFKMVLIGLVTAVCVHLGLPEAIATSISDVVFYLISAYVLGDTLRPSIKL